MRIWAPMLCLFVAGAVAAASGNPDVSPHPDVFLITIDTLRSDHIHCYGYQAIETPSLDELASRGIRFTEAFTPSPITNSSHTSILTGLLPSSNGVTDFGVPLLPEHPVLAELLAQRGYRTAAFIGSVILDSKTLAPGLDRGFEFYDNFPQNAATKSRWGRLERRGMDVVQRAESWLKTHSAAPRFMWVHLYDPHDPYEPPIPYSDKYRDRLYDGEIAYADSALGHFLSYLKSQNAYESALIIVVADHGEGLGEHHEDTHGIFLYDSTTHVPLIIKLPNNQKAGTVIDDQVRTIDIAPTILELLGVPEPAALDGRSLNALMFGGDSPPRTAFGETDYPLRFGWAPLRSVRNEGFKFIEAPRPELYDLSSDPGELRNRYVPWDTTVQNLRKILADSPERLRKTTVSPGAVSSDTLHELQALGYFGAADARSSTNVPEPSLLPDPKDKVEEQNLIHIAMIASEGGRLLQAKTALEKLLELNNTSAFALCELARLEMESKAYSEAADYFRRARIVRPDDANVAYDYGRALLLAGDAANAKSALEASLKLDSQQVRTRLLLGQAYLKLNDLKSAEDQFATALVLEPGNKDLQMSLAQTLLSEKKFADAAELLEQSTTSQGNTSELFDLLAQAYSALGKTEKAQKAKERAKTLRPSRTPQ